MSHARAVQEKDEAVTTEATGRQSTPPDQSHVVRRRMLSSAPAHEVGLDEVELIDDPPRDAPTSEAPVALDAWPDSAPFNVPTIAIAPPPRRAGFRAAITLVMIALLAVVAMVS